MTIKQCYKKRGWEFAGAAGSHRSCRVMSVAVVFTDPDGNPDETDLLYTPGVHELFGWRE